MAHDVFVSYKGEDRQVAEKICDDLAKRDVKCWISSREIRAGFSHQQVIADALIDAVVMVLVFSSAANESDEILKELSIASMLKKHVIPVRIEDVFPKHGPYFYELAARQYIDLFPDWEKQIDRLAEDIKIIVKHKMDSTREKDEQTRKETLSDKEKATNDKTYLDLLQVASADGAIASSERDFLDRKASELGISPDRAKALEAEVFIGAEEEKASQSMFGGGLKKGASILGGLRRRILKKSEKSKKH
jgi:hypothetical protein